MAFINKNKSMVFGGYLSLLLMLVYTIYSQGLNGVFFFDDMPNLSPLAKYTDYSYWDRFWLFILEGFSGPTGRPISLASFYFNDNHWPTKASIFIFTNIFIHLLNSALVFWLSLKLSKILNVSANRQFSFILLATALWALHPLHATTVLYVIQRMTELSATFMLIGLLFYLYGRELLRLNPLKGFFTLFIGVGISLLLAILSKENGVLLVAYIIVIEFFLLRPLKIPSPKNFTYWLLPAVILPFILIIGYLGIRIDPDSFSGRDFSLTERLLTQPRVLFDYLYQIILPRMNDFTLFHDDYAVSKDILHPITTLPSIVGIIFLATTALVLRKKLPVIGFTIAWFFAGHMIESTVLPLEMYFEHRNYLPLYGISFIIAWYASQLLETQKSIIILICGSILALYAFILVQNANLWGKPLQLTTSWYAAHPNSERSQHAYEHASQAFGVKPVLVGENNKVSKPGTTFYSASIIVDLINHCKADTIDSQSVNNAAASLQSNLLTPAVSNRLNDFMRLWLAGKCPSAKANTLERFFQSLLTIKSIQQDKKLKRTLHYLLSHVYKMKGDLHNTMQHINKAYFYDPDSELLIQRVGYLESAGLYKEALKMLNDRKSLTQKGFRESMTLKIKQKEFNKIENKLLEKIEVKK